MKNFLELLPNNYLPLIANGHNEYPAIYDSNNKEIYIFFESDIVKFNKFEIAENFTLYNLNGIKLDLEKLFNNI